MRFNWAKLNWIRRFSDQTGESNNVPRTNGILRIRIAKHIKYDANIFCSIGIISLLYIFIIYEWIGRCSFSKTNEPLCAIPGPLLSLHLYMFVRRHRLYILYINTTGFFSWSHVPQHQIALRKCESTTWIEMNWALAVAQYSCVSLSPCEQWTCRNMPQRVWQAAPALHPPSLCIASCLICHPTTEHHWWIGNSFKRVQTHSNAFIRHATTHITVCVRTTVSTWDPMNDMGTRRVPFQFVANCRRSSMYFALECWKLHTPRHQRNVLLRMHKRPLLAFHSSGWENLW